METPTEAPQEAPPELSRREEIIEAAVAAFAKGGYHGTSMEDIAAKVGVRKRALYHYFTSKDELLFVTLKQPTETMIERLRKISSSSDPATEKLHQAICFHVATLVERSDEFSVLLNETKYLTANRKRQIIALRDRYEGLFRKIIEAGIETGELRGLDAKIVTFSIMGITNWLHQWYKPGKTPPEELADRFWDILCGGILASGNNAITVPCP